MILALDVSEKVASGFIIKPNQAMSWRGLTIAYGVIVIFSLSIAIMFYTVGLTLILPFSGLELLALGAALYVTARRGGRQEIIRVTADQIIVESGCHCLETRQEFQRHWASVILERSWNHWYPSRLLIRSHGHQVEVGKFLNEQERQGLAVELKNVLLHTNNKIINHQICR